MKITKQLLPMILHMYLPKQKAFEQHIFTLIGETETQFTQF